MASYLAERPALPSWSAVGGTVAKIVLGSAALAVSAKVQVPFWPVPMTLQTLVVLLLGVGFSPRVGALAVLAYLTEGLVGLPVFAGALAGPGAFAGPTAGFLIGFLPAVVLVGWLAARGGVQKVSSAFAVMLAAHAVIFACGVSWLAHLIGWQQAVAFGLMPFIAGTFVKCALATGLTLAIRRG